MNTPATRIDLRCPKCHGDLVVYERQGIVVDQCRDCRGVWLDRGELEHLIDLEAAYARRAAQADVAPRADDRRAEPDRRDRDDDRRGRDDDRYDARRYDDDRYDDRRGRGGDRRSNLFGDIFGDILGG
jgi:hypothetical protein